MTRQCRVLQLAASQHRVRCRRAHGQLRRHHRTFSRAPPCRAGALSSSWLCLAGISKFITDAAAQADFAQQVWESSDRPPDPPTDQPSGRRFLHSGARAT